MLPFGRKHPVKVKDLRIKRKLPAYPVMPSVRDRDGRTVWLPGVRHSGEYPAEPGSRMRLFFAEKM
jgi:hypothetical protein